MGLGDRERRRQAEKEGQERTEKSKKNQTTQKFATFLRPFFLLSYSLFFLLPVFWFLKLFQLMGERGIRGSSPLSLTTSLSPATRFHPPRPRPGADPAAPSASRRRRHDVHEVFVKRKKRLSVQPAA